MTGNFAPVRTDGSNSSASASAWDSGARFVVEHLAKLGGRGDANFRIAEMWPQISQEITPRFFRIRDVAKEPVSNAEIDDLYEEFSLEVESGQIEQRVLLRRVWDEGGCAAGSLGEAGLPALRWARDLEDRITAAVEALAGSLK